MEAVMRDSVHRKNLERFRQLLAHVTDDEQREQIKRLIAEEEAKDHPPFDPPEKH